MIHLFPFAMVLLMEVKGSSQVHSWADGELCFEVVSVMNILERLRPIQGTNTGWFWHIIFCFFLSEKVVFFHKKSWVHDFFLGEVQ